MHYLYLVQSTLPSSLAPILLHFPSNDNPKLFSIQKMQQDFPQDNSSLLAKLPPEICRQIYTHILLGWGLSLIVHIHLAKRLRHYRCQIGEGGFSCDGTHPTKRNDSCAMLWYEFEASVDAGWKKRMEWYVRKGVMIFCLSC